MTANIASLDIARRAIFIGGLGYFVDLFDIQLFAVLRVASLTDIGVPTEQMATIGGNILNAQMVGMILGAFLWGWLGDRYGRFKVLYGSILIYSLGTFACAFVQDPVTYGLMRFVTGFGLAGETGAAITIIAELMSPQKRGWGITIMGAFAFLGPAVAVVISWFAPWRETYIITGVLGLLLFILRLKLAEPAMFEKTRMAESVRGSWRLIWQAGKAPTFLYCLMLGFPLIFAWQFLIFFSKELGQFVIAPGETFDQKFCLLAFYVGTSLGDMGLGAMSQWLHSRRKPLFFCYIFGIALTALYLVGGPIWGMSAHMLYAVYFCLGLFGGGFILMGMMAAEQFGTNIRATTGITIINLVRGLTIPIILAFQALREHMDIAMAGALIGAVCYVTAFFAVARLKETHGTDLDYVE